MQNAKLSVSDMKEIIELFVKNKMNSLRIGDFEIQKSFYEPENNQTSNQDPLFFSAPQFPPEIEALLQEMKK